MILLRMICCCAKNGLLLLEQVWFCCFNLYISFDDVKWIVYCLNDGSMINSSVYYYQLSYHFIISKLNNNDIMLCMLLFGLQLSFDFKFELKWWYYLIGTILSHVISIEYYDSTCVSMTITWSQEITIITWILNTTHLPFIL